MKRVIKNSYKTWSRKGECPGCGVGTGCKHKPNCSKRQEMLLPTSVDAIPRSISIKS